MDKSFESVEIVFSSKKQLRKSIKKAYSQGSLDIDTYTFINTKIIPSFDTHGWNSTQTEHLRNLSPHRLVELKTINREKGTWTRTMIVNKIPPKDVISGSTSIGEPNRLFVGEPTFAAAPQADPSPVLMRDVELVEQAHALQAPVNIEAESALSSDYEDSVIGDLKTLEDISNDHVFLACIACARMIYIRCAKPSKFPAQFRTKNMVLPTTCSKCKNLVSAIPPRFAETSNDLKLFETMGIHVSLMAKSDVMRIALAVVGEDAYLANDAGLVVYMHINDIMKCIPTGSEIRSVDKEAFVEGRKSHVLQSHLLTGFL
ncbi:hypothetical protein CKM354_001126200 [Cercospora kikuchii]|uniref:Uncharacterized protein n=1 Tax=Cercospora kikuchii TaxID=84275 RepID=A0A9P3CSU1_9PEZI|nr:uncharacterized protein CKM354_001126200 [Cercospora kikuchii]GIZ48191.1 hypothetical protein CKM354_001126200 [Cercospora kikuchii]